MMLEFNPLSFSTSHACYVRSFKGLAMKGAAMNQPQIRVTTQRGVAKCLMNQAEYMVPLV